MPELLQIEICAENLEGAVAAFEGGADRVELCSDLGQDGLTPSLDTLQEVKNSIPIPVMAMVRPKADGFVPSVDDREAIEMDLARVLDAGADGVVLGILTPEGRIDQAALAYLVEKAHGKPVTFHKAFDQIPDLEEGLESLVRCGVRRVLTSGGEATALEGTARLAGLVSQAGDRITVMPGGGVRAGHARDLALQTGARAIHSGLDRNPTPTSVRELVESL